MRLTEEQLRKSAEALAKLHGIPLKAAVQLVTESYNRGYEDGRKCT